MSVTITPALRAARERLARKGIDASVGELALTGAQQLLGDAADHERDEAQRRELRVRLVESIRLGEFVDTQALDRVREHGWNRV